MGARTTLNGIYLTGAVVIAGLLGTATGSWLVFAISLVVLVLANMHSGRIRPKGRGRIR